MKDNRIGLDQVNYLVHPVACSIDAADAPPDVDSGPVLRPVIR